MKNRFIFKEYELNRIISESLKDIWQGFHESSQNELNNMLRSGNLPTTPMDAVKLGSRMIGAGIDGAMTCGMTGMSPKQIRYAVNTNNIQNRSSKNQANDRLSMAKYSTTTNSTTIY